MTWSKQLYILGFILLVVSNLNCFKYSFKGALPSNLKTIAIPLFEDRSRWPGLQEEMTQNVIDAFIRENTLQVEDNEDEVDLLLTATIVSVRERNTSVTANEQVEEMQMEVSVKVECMNLHTEKPLWTGTISDNTVISAGATLAEREQAVDEAAERIVEEILIRTVAAW